jgi:hypothetical protein
MVISAGVTQEFQNEQWKQNPKWTVVWSTPIEGWWEFDTGYFGFDGLFVPGAEGTIVVPYWFLLLVCIGLAAVLWLPWLPWKFSLRTLLIASTVLAVVLGLVVWSL